MDGKKLIDHILDTHSSYEIGLMVDNVVKLSNEIARIERKHNASGIFYELENGKYVSVRRPVPGVS